MSTENQVRTDAEGSLEDIFAVGSLYALTAEQRAIAEPLLCGLTDQVVQMLNAKSPAIQEMDKRPREVWSEAQPDVYFRYVNQYLLEKLIERLQALV